MKQRRIDGLVKVSEDYLIGKQEALMRETSVVNFSRPFDVNVCHDHEENLWVAECDALGLVTEAATYEELTERVWEIAPELYELNGLGGNPNRIRLSFNQTQSYSDRIAL